jgi:hypothetical protein
MFDFKGCFDLIKSVMVDKAKEEHKPRLCNKASMAAYAKATGNTGKASFGIQQADMIVEYVA